MTDRPKSKRKKRSLHKSLRGKKKSSCEKRKPEAEEAKRSSSRQKKEKRSSLSFRSLTLRKRAVTEAPSQPNSSSSSIQTKPRSYTTNPMSQAEIDNMNFKALMGSHAGSSSSSSSSSKGNTPLSRSEMMKEIGKLRHELQVQTQIAEKLQKQKMETKKIEGTLGDDWYEYLNCLDYIICQIHGEHNLTLPEKKMVLIGNLLVNEEAAGFQALTIETIKVKKTNAEIIKYKATLIDQVSNHYVDVAMNQVAILKEKAKKIGELYTKQKKQQHESELKLREEIATLEKKLADATNQNQSLTADKLKLTKGFVLLNGKMKVVRAKLSPDQEAWSDAALKRLLIGEVKTLLKAEELSIEEKAREETKQTYEAELDTLKERVKAKVDSLTAEWETEREILKTLAFGNEAESSLENIEPGCDIRGLLINDQIFLEKLASGLIKRRSIHQSFSQQNGY